MSKCCSICSRTLPIAEFSKNQLKNGASRRCKACVGADLLAKPAQAGGDTGKAGGPEVDAAKMAKVADLAETAVKAMQPKPKRTSSFERVRRALGVSGKKSSDDVVEDSTPDAEGKSVELSDSERAKRAEKNAKKRAKQRLKSAAEKALAKERAQGAEVTTMSAEELAKKDAEELAAKQKKAAESAAAKEALEQKNVEREAALAKSGKRAAGGMHKFDAEEVDVHGGTATADDFLDAFGFGDDGPGDEPAASEEATEGEAGPVGQPPMRAPAPAALPAAPSLQPTPTKPSAATGAGGASNVYEAFMASEESKAAEEGAADEKQIDVKVAEVAPPEKATDAAARDESKVAAAPTATAAASAPAPAPKSGGCCVVM
jgi:hypothetical protein